MKSRTPRTTLQTIIVIDNAGTVTVLGRDDIHRLEKIVAGLKVPASAKNACADVVSSAHAEEVNRPTTRAFLEVGGGIIKGGLGIPTVPDTLLKGLYQKPPKPKKINIKIKRRKDLSNLGNNLNNREKP